jgi:hypothetical protein
MTESFEAWLRSTVEHIADDVADIHAKVITHDVTLKHVDHRLSKLEGDVSDTGKHEVADLKKALAEARKKQYAAVWQVAKWVVSAIGGVGLLALGYLIGGHR